MSPGLPPELPPPRTNLPPNPPMQRLPFVLLLLVLVTALPSCRTYHGSYHVGADDYLLAQREQNGKKESFHLIAAGNASLRVTTEYDREKPFLGLKVGELDKTAAEHRGVRPYTGLVVLEVVPGSPAAEAGVMAKDVLQSLDGVETVYVDQFRKIVARLSAEQKVEAKVLRGQDVMDVALFTRMQRERVTDSEDIPLEPPTMTHRPYCGASLRGIPTSWCERIYGSARNAVVVTSVEVGSPAWLAGVRGGDVVDEVDGAPVPSAEELSRRIADAGPQGATMTWKVSRGPNDKHEAAIGLDDYSGESNLNVPLLLCVENGVFEDSWSLGLGLVMRNSNQYVANSRTRQVQTRNVFSAVLGLFRLESNPDETRVRLLWFIHFDT